MQKDNEKLKNDEGVLKLKGANMDIDFISDKKDIHWEQDKCPWNIKENTNAHKCAVKNVSICKYFNGIEPMDMVMCLYKKNNSF